jgi:hypothetical protein
MKFKPREESCSPLNSWITVPANRSQYPDSDDEILTEPKGIIVPAEIDEAEPGLEAEDYDVVVPQTGLVVKDKDSPAVGKKRGSGRFGPVAKQIYR